MEFVPRATLTTVAPAEAARRRSIREAGVAAVAAALGMTEGAGPHASAQAPSPMPSRAEREPRLSSAKKAA